MLPQRVHALTGIGLLHNPSDNTCSRKDIVINGNDIANLDDNAFNILCGQIKERINTYKDYYEVDLTAIEQQTTKAVATTPQPEDKDVKMFTESLAIFQAGPQVLKENKLSVIGAKAALQQLLDDVAANSGKMNEELDKRANNLLVKINSTIKTMNGKRSGFTQLATALSKQFTTLEAELDPTKAGTLPNQVQKLRNDWAGWLQQEALRKQKEAEEKAAKEKQKADFVAAIITFIGSKLAEFLYNKKLSWNKSFSEITLDNFIDKAEKLEEANALFNSQWLPKILVFDNPFSPLTPLEQADLRTATIRDYDFNPFMQQYNNEMTELKQSLLDRLPSKKAELEEAADAEEKRQAELRRQAEEKRKREEAIAKANAEEQARLKEEARIAEEKEQARIAEIEKEQQRQAEERKLREEEEELKLKKQRAEEEQKAKNAGTMAGASMVAGSLFETAAALSETPLPPESRNGYEITVNNPAGWVEIFQFWYTAEGVKSPVEEMGKKSLNQMKKYVEDVAKKSGEKIASKYLVYKPITKAVNKKEKEQ